MWGEKQSFRSKRKYYIGLILHEWCLACRICATPNFHFYHLCMMLQLSLSGWFTVFLILLVNLTSTINGFTPNKWQHVVLFHQKACLSLLSIPGPNIEIHWSMFVDFDIVTLWWDFWFASQKSSVEYTTAGATYLEVRSWKIKHRTESSARALSEEQREYSQWSVHSSSLIAHSLQFDMWD